MAKLPGIGARNRPLNVAFRPASGWGRLYRFTLESSHRRDSNLTGWCSWGGSGAGWCGGAAVTAAVETGLWVRGGLEAGPVGLVGCEGVPAGVPGWFLLAV